MSEQFKHYSYEIDVIYPQHQQNVEYWKRHYDHMVDYYMAYKKWVEDLQREISGYQGLSNEYEYWVQEGRRSDERADAIQEQLNTLRSDYDKMESVVRILNQRTEVQIREIRRLQNKLRLTKKSKLESEIKLLTKEMEGIKK